MHLWEPEEWGEGMRRWRRASGVRAADLARRLDLEVETLRHLEDGDLLPDDRLRALWEDELLRLDTRGRPPSFARVLWRHRREVALFVLVTMAAALVAVCSR